MINFLKFARKWQEDVDLNLISIVMLLSVLGFIAVGSSDIGMSSRISISNFYLFKKHLLFSVFGFCLMIFISTLSYEFIYKTFRFIFFILFLLLVVNIFLGTEIKGSKRWLNLGLISIQPTELMKPFFILTQASIIYFFKRKTAIILFSLNAFIVIFIIFNQPDLGTSIIYIFTTWIQIFLSGVSQIFIFFLPIFGILIFIISYILLPHVKFRVDLFLRDELHYQAYQSTKAIKTAGLFGSGLGDGTIKYRIPDCYTDYIFSVISEEFGYIGIVCIMILYIKFFFRGLFAIKKQNEMQTLNFNIATTSLFLIFFQFMINILVAVNAIPTKGMPLPFLSYGGSSLLSLYILIGLILAFSRKSYGYVR